MTDKIRIRESGSVVSDNAFRIMHNDTSFPSVLTADILNDFGADPVFDGISPQYDPDTQYLKQDGVEEIDGKWFTKTIVVNYTPEEIAARFEAWRKTTNCTPFQGRIALADAGLLSQVEAAITSADEKTKIAWEYALIWERMSPMILTLMAALNISDTQADDLFKAAQKITA